MDRLAYLLVLVGIAGGAAAEEGAAVPRISRLETFLQEQGRQVADRPEGTQFAGRDTLLSIAREAREAGTSVDRKLPADGIPPPSSREPFLVSLTAYDLLRIGEAIRLSRAETGAEPLDWGPFSVAWDEEVSAILRYLERWPGLYSEPIEGADRRLFLPSHLLLVCRIDAMAGDDWELPAGFPDSRSATVPESLASCCLSAEACRTIWNEEDCSRGLLAELALSVERDAWVGFRYGKTFWSLAPGERPGGARLEQRVALATIQFALDLLRGSNRLAGEAFDPFETVPGLRNPRSTLDGRQVSDLVLYRACYLAAHETARQELERALGTERRLILLDD